MSEMENSLDGIKGIPEERLMDFKTQQEKIT